MKEHLKACMVYAMREAGRPLTEPEILERVHAMTPEDEVDAWRHWCTINREDENHDDR